MAKTKNKKLPKLGVISTPNTPPTSSTLHPNSEVMIHKEGKIILRSDKINKKGLAPLKYQIFIQKEKVEIGIKVSCRPESFIEKSQEIIERTESDKYANVVIRMVLSKAHNILVRATLSDIQLTKQYFIERFNNPESKEDFVEYFHKRLNEKLYQKKLENSTYETQMVIYRKIKRYKERWPFSQINDKFIEEFTEWLKIDLKNASLRLGKPQVNKGANAIGHTLKVIKTYLIEAQKDKIQFEMPNYNIKWAKTNRVALSKDERRLLINLYNSNELGDTTKQQALEMFLFACNTGLRISDIKRLRAEHFDHEFIKIIPHKTKKDQKVLNIPITEFVKQVIANRPGKIFPTVAEQTINEKLKEIAFQVGIMKNITMHVGRHTFATLWLQNSNDLKALSDALGHSNITTTQQYLHVDTAHIKKAFKPHEDSWNED